jgi:ribosomal protein S18 acetylase RimI-like enzyme
MEQLAHGRPVLAFDSGGFAEIPADALVRVPLEDWDATAAALRELVEYPERRIRVGAAARRVAATYNVDAYAEGVLELIREVRRWRPGLHVLDRAAAELGLMGLHDGSTVVDALIEEAQPIFRWEATLADPDPAAAVRFRRLAADDREAFRAFLEANDVPAVTATFDPFPMRAAEADRILDEMREDRYYGAFTATGELVGFSMLRGWDEGYEVPSFGIAVDHRRHGNGLGGRLTRWTIRRAQELGAPAVRLSVYSDNPNARALYSGLGFVETERSSAGERERIVMRLTV